MLGLVVCGAGCLLFYPAAETEYTASLGTYTISIKFPIYSVSSFFGGQQPSPLLAAGSVPMAWTRAVTNLDDGTRVESPVAYTFTVSGSTPPYPVAQTSTGFSEPSHQVAFHGDLRRPALDELCAKALAIPLGHTGDGGPIREPLAELAQG